MMRRLFIMRHAKAARPTPGQDDFDRPLTDRGRSDADEIGRVIATEGYAPATVICSSAKRTRETLDGLLRSLPGDIEVRMTRNAYGAAPDALLGLVGATRPEIAGVMVVGHNPELHTLAIMLTAAAEPLRTGLPTGTLAIIGFDTETWENLPPSGKLLAFHVPRGDSR